MDEILKCHNSKLMKAIEQYFPVALSVYYDVQGGSTS